MMSKQVLDASALLAYLFDENGADLVEKELFKGVLISTVNLSEVFSKLEERGVTINTASEQFQNSGLYYALEIVDFDMEQAKAAAGLRLLTKSIALSLGDRACLALACLKGVTAITADDSWKQLKEVKVKMIR